MWQSVHPLQYFLILCASTKRDAEVEKTDNIKHAIKGAQLVDLDSIDNEVHNCSDDVDVDLSSLFDSEIYDNSVTVYDQLCCVRIKMQMK